MEGRSSVMKLEMKGEEESSLASLAASKPSVKRKSILKTASARGGLGVEQLKARFEKKDVGLEEVVPGEDGLVVHVNEKTARL